jgi:6-phosphofructokinase
MSDSKKLGILVGGGPAPGINSVIGAATIRSLLEGVEVVGIKDGFEWIMQGNTEHVVRMTIDLVSRLHFRGGSFIGISRANPTKNPQHLERCIDALLHLGIDRLVTIGGDDTAFTAMKLAEKSAGRVRVVHVPAHRHLRLPDRPARRRRDREEPDGRRVHDLEVVHRHLDGA